MLHFIEPLEENGQILKTLRLVYVLNILHTIKVILLLNFVPNVLLLQVFNRNHIINLLEEHLVKIRISVLLVVN